MNQKQRVTGKKQWTEKKSINILVIVGSHWMEQKKKKSLLGVKKEERKLKWKM